MAEHGLPKPRMRVRFSLPAPIIIKNFKVILNMSKEKQKAIELFYKRYNCTQAIFIAYSSKFGFNEEDAFKLSYGFGGGIASTENLCGVISAAVMLLSLKYAASNINDIKSKEIAKAKIQEFMSKFNTNHAKLNCRDILRENSPTVYPRHSEKCLMLVSEVCDFLDKEL